MKAKGIPDNHALQAYFNSRLLKILTAHGKRMMGWDEILHPDLPKNAVIQSWRGPEGLAAAASAGYDVLLSNGYYIDLIQPASKHYAVDPLPVDGKLSADQAAHVLGGEATMWSEYVGPETIDSRIWPRTAAIAERLWSPAAVTDVDDMYRRLDSVSVELEMLGLTHQRNVAMLLRRLAGSDGIAPLQTLLTAVEPVKEYNRGDQRPTTMLSPLTSLVDAARPESREAREFRAMVEALLEDAPRFELYQDRVCQRLESWRDLGTVVSGAGGAVSGAARARADRSKPCLGRSDRPRGDPIPCLGDAATGGLVAGAAHDAGPGGETERGPRARRGDERSKARGCGGRAFALAGARSCGVARGGAGPLVRGLDALEGRLVGLSAVER